MKKIYLLFMLSIYGLTSAAQNKNQRLTDSLKSDSIAAIQIKGNSADLDLQRTIVKRIKNYTFVQQTLNYAALSYASPPFFDLSSPKHGYVLSADISPHFVIGGKWMPFPIHLTARYKVRIFRDNKAVGDSSLPVRTPSFMPGVTIYFPINKYMSDESNKIKYLSLSVFHHSDGQDGPELKTDGSVNVYNGNFSTNYFEPAYHFRSRFPKDTSVAYPHNYHDLYGRLGFEQHFGTTEPLKSSYGDHRINFTLGWIRVKNYQDIVKDTKIDDPYYREVYRIVFNATLIVGDRDRGMSPVERRVNADLTYHWRIPSSPNASLFAGVGYYGSDPYNIYYQQHYGFVRAGIALGFFVAPNMIGTRKR